MLERSLRGKGAEEGSGHVLAFAADDLEIWEEKLAAAAPPFVVALRPFDLFRGGGLPNGRKSVAILVLMQDTARTLTDAEIDRAVESLAATARDAYGATLRSQDVR